MHTLTPENRLGWGLLNCRRVLVHVEFGHTPKMEGCEDTVQVAIAS